MHRKSSLIPWYPVLSHQYLACEYPVGRLYVVWLHSYPNLPRVGSTVGMQDVRQCSALTRYLSYLVSLLAEPRYSTLPSLPGPPFFPVKATPYFRVHSYVEWKAFCNPLFLLIKTTWKILMAHFSRLYHCFYLFNFFARFFLCCVSSPTVDSTMLLYINKNFLKSSKCLVLETLKLQITFFRKSLWIVKK